MDMNETIKQFEEHVPISDKSLMILKAHLVIERRILEFIKERVPDKLYKKIDKQKEGAFYIRVLLAHALSCRDEIPCDDRIWASLEKLGKLRNDIAHKLEHKGSSLNDKMIDFINTVNFDGKLWSTKLTDENLLRTFWYATIFLNSLLALEREPGRIANENL